MKNKKVMAILLAGTMALSMTACGQKPNNTVDPEPAQTEEAAEETTEETAEEATEEITEEIAEKETYVDDESLTPKEGGTFKLGIYGSPTCIGYPADILTMMNREASQPAMETLCQVGEDGNLEPMLLESYEALPEEKKLVLHLRDGVMFHDGTPLDAEAVKYNLDTAIEFLGLVYPCEIEIVVVDEKTVEIQMSEWIRGIDYDFLYEYGKMGSPTYLESVDYETACFNPVGTGAYVFESYDVDQKITYTKNENYWGEGAYVDAIEIYIFNDEAAIKSALKTGEIDAVIDAEYTVNADYAEMEDVIKTSRNVQSGSMTYNILFGVLDETSVLADANVRKAISSAVDFKTIAESMEAYGCVYTNQIAGEGFYNYTDNVEGYPYDVEKAKEYLAEAEFEEGTEIQAYYYNAEPVAGDILVMMQAYLEQIGIKLNINPIDIAALTEYMFDGNCDGMIVTGNNGTPQQMTIFQEQMLGGAPGTICEAMLVDNMEAVEQYDLALRAFTEEEEIEYVAAGNEIAYDEECITNGILTLYPQAYAKDYVHGSKIGYCNAIQWSPSTVWLDK